jgi:hypothetical protein
VALARSNLIFTMRRTSHKANCPGLGRPQGRAGLVRHWGSAPVARVWNQMYNQPPTQRKQQQLLRAPLPNNRLLLACCL